jgi:nicotinate-nucleotide pyrophosphorylase (carboxylating)
MNYETQLSQLINNALNEDIGDGDHSTLSCISLEAKGKAILKIKENSIISGIAVAEKIFKTIQPDCEFIQIKKDGDTVNSGEIAFEINANIHTILKCERLVLNTMQRMSGISTLTKQYVNELTGYRTQLLDTRKTTPNFRLLEKEAVRIGGGINHRFGLYDMIMLKDNHIDYCGSIEKAIISCNEYISKNKLNLKIEVETRNLEDVKRVLSVGNVDRIMLDNFTPEEIKNALELIAGKYETEASGGINIQNIKEYAATGVDYISCGAVIHQARSIDLSLKATLI